MISTAGSRCSRCGAELTNGDACARCLLELAAGAAGNDQRNDASWLSALDDNDSASQRYELIQEIARGGMGVIYRARHCELNRMVAVKMILPHQLRSPAVLQRFRSEARAVAALDHPGILPIYEVGELDGLPFFSMKLVDGGSLASQMANWRQRPREAARLIVDVAHAVHHAHQRGILHRDLKPGNILLSREGQAYVSDFGIAKWLERQNALTIDASTLGTPYYIAPEQAAGATANLGPAADVYSLGAILYELLTGQPPFAADTAIAILRQVTDKHPPPPRKLNPTVPRDLEVICLKCLEKEPSARYRSAAALAEDLERWLGGETIRARPAHLVERAWRLAKRNRATTAAVVIMLLAAGALLYDWARSRSPHHPQTNVAVLPFHDESAAHDQQFLCDGISEEIIDSLARTPQLHVIGRTSSFALRDKETDLKTIASAVNVGTVIQGAVARSADHVRINAQIVRTADSGVLWSQTYQGELQNVATIRNEITSAIAERLGLPSTPAAAAARNPVAYDLWLRGLHYSNKSSEEDLRKAIDLFQQALDNDPTFGRAWTGIAKSWLWLADEYVRPLDAYPIVKAAAEKALALDPNDAEAHVYRGEAIRALDWDYNGDEAELRRALQLDPNSAAAHMFLALLRTGTGNPADRLTEIETARRLDPLSPIISTFATQVYLIMDRIPDAIAEAERMNRLDPNYSYYDDSLAAAYRQAGRLPEAIALYEKAESVTHVPQAGLGVTYARAGRREDALRVASRLIEVAKTRYTSADQIADIFAALGEKDEAFRWLDRAVADHASPLEGVAVRPNLRSLHSDPRFPELLRRIGLDPQKLLQNG